MRVLADRRVLCGGGRGAPSAQGLCCAVNAKLRPLPPPHRRPSPSKLAAQRPGDAAAAKRKASPTRKATESVRSALGGAVAAERSRLAAKARAGVPGLAVQGFNTTGLGATGQLTGSLGGTAPPLRATLGASMAAPRGAAAGRAAAAVTARLAHIDALLAKSKAAAGGARGYGDLWPASLGKAPAPSQAEAAQVAADAEPVLESVAALQDWEVACAMEAAQWAVTHWEAPFGASSAISTPEPEQEARHSARVSSLFLAARLRMEMDETAVLGELVSSLVDSAFSDVYAALDGEGDAAAEAADGEEAEAVVHQLVEEAVHHVMAELDDAPQEEAAAKEAEEMGQLVAELDGMGGLSMMRKAVMAKKAKMDAQKLQEAEAQVEEAQAGRVSASGGDAVGEASAEPRDEPMGEAAEEAPAVTDE